MSFNGESKGQMYEPGYFLTDDENCVRETREISQESAAVVTAENGGKYVPMGTVYPEIGDKAEGITYEDVDVTNGNMPGSVVTKGTVVKDRIPLAVSQLTVSTLSALTAKGFKFIDETPTVTRPDFS